MDYSNSDSIKGAGREAFLNGLELEDCPIDRRVNANAVHHWNYGWNDASKRSCAGKNCRSLNGVNHSDECEKEHDSNYDI